MLTPQIVYALDAVSVPDQSSLCVRLSNIITSNTSHKGVSSCCEHLPFAGPSAEDGLGLRSFRVAGGLQATTRLKTKYQAFPGIINGGVISALFDCHGNWTAAIALMDRSGLPRPPLTLTSELLVHFLLIELLKQGSLDIYG